MIGARNRTCCRCRHRDPPAADAWAADPQVVAQRDTARHAIERFAQREPFRGEPLRHPVSASANPRTCIVPARKLLTNLPRCFRHRMTQSRAEDHPPQRLRQIDVIARGTHHAGFRRHQLPAAPPALSPPARRASTLPRPPCRSLPNASRARTDRPHATRFERRLAHLAGEAHATRDAEFLGGGGKRAGMHGITLPEPTTVSCQSRSNSRASARSSTSCPLRAPACRSR